MPSLLYESIENTEGHLAVVRYLVSAGSVMLCLNVVCRQRSNQLDCSVCFRFDTTLTDHQGYMAVDIARQRGCAAIAAVLEHGAGSGAETANQPLDEGLLLFWAAATGQTALLALPAGGAADHVIGGVLSTAAVVNLQRLFPRYTICLHLSSV